MWNYLSHLCMKTNVLSFSRSQFCSQRLLCRTLAGNNVHVLTISSPDCLEEVRGKICIVLSARSEHFT